MMSMSKLSLFNEVVEEVKGLKLFNSKVDERADNDFNIVINDGLLNPSFYIHEIHGGERVVDEVVFDVNEQAFYLRDNNVNMARAEVILLVKRSLIVWLDTDARDSFGSYVQISSSLVEAKRIGVDLNISEQFKETFSELMEQLIVLHEQVAMLTIDIIIKLYELDRDEKILDAIKNDREQIDVLSKELE